MESVTSHAFGTVMGRAPLGGDGKKPPMGYTLPSQAFIAVSFRTCAVTPVNSQKFTLRGFLIGRNCVNGKGGSI